jgi:alanyl-tRNA synthetase
MTSAQIRQIFLEFFKSRGHQIVPSAPLVIKNDPTLMFTNAGMNQFKDWFLGHETPRHKRVANTQKCLRVSGKHNDLESVGVDTYHHTFFEMLGNWSFGDYFKAEAIAWAWELLTGMFAIDPDRLYATVFEGDSDEHIPFDQEAYDHWAKYMAVDHILKGSKYDNFWEMGETGPCGPCTEIHIDLRPESERQQIPGHRLVNAGHPSVIELWNLVFIQFDRKSNGQLEPLPARHVDTGMGFERLCMVLQQKQSNYDTDIFLPLLTALSEISGLKYGMDDKTDIAFRVCADHIRAIACAIADGQLPSNNKAGYVIRRILRRAVRYGFKFLHQKHPFLYRLVPVFARQVKDVFPEVQQQSELIEQVVREEETSFLKTLESGIRRFESWPEKTISGEFAFELYDTYGFPFDLTRLMAREMNKTVDEQGFQRCLEQQKKRSRADAEVETSDWIILKEDATTEFTGYDTLSCSCRIVRYREVTIKGRKYYHLVLDKTPFYAESGGQVGDTGWLIAGNEKVEIMDTRKENNLIIHQCNRLPADLHGEFIAQVDEPRRKAIMANHSATHLMHAALRQVLGPHVTQQGSLVNEKLTRFDFSHFRKVTEEELSEIEAIVNQKIQEDIPLHEERQIPIKEALSKGAIALFGEKYGEQVRVITFDKNFSVELCGGTHVQATSQIGLFKFISESSVAAGVRRVEAVTGKEAWKYVNQKIRELHQIHQLLGFPKDSTRAIHRLLEENQRLRKEKEILLAEKASVLKQELKSKAKHVNGVMMIAEQIPLTSAEAVKSLCFALRNEIKNLFLLLGYESEGKAYLSLIISETLLKQYQWDASRIIRELAREIGGDGGGQPFFASAGGSHPQGLTKALQRAEELVRSTLMQV